MIFLHAPDLNEKSGGSKEPPCQKRGKGAKGDRRERILLWLTHDTISKFLYLMVFNDGPPVF